MKDYSTVELKKRQKLNRQQKRECTTLLEIIYRENLRSRIVTIM